MMTFDPVALVAQLTDAAADLHQTAPATVVQFEQGNLAVAAATGVTNLNGGRPAEAAQTFEIGSQTKMMTSVVILQLVEDGLIDLDARAADYLPDSITAGLANADTATVRQLLNMTSGIANYTEAVDADGVPLFVAFIRDHPDQVFGPAEGLALARDMLPTGAPGEAFYYSNTNYALLGQIIEGLTGQSFVQALQARVFDPAGMTHTVRQLDSGDPRLSSYLDAGDGNLINVTHALWEMRGEAGVVSNTADMISFLKALLVDKTLLGPAALAQMEDWLDTGSGPGFATFFGLGLVRVTIGDHTFVGFTGGTLGTGSSTYLDVGTGTVVSLAASSDAADTANGALALFQALQAAAQFQPVVDDGGPLTVASGSAAAMRLVQTADGLAFTVGTAALTLDRAVAALTTASLTFADGSVLVVGDNQAGRTGDAAGNDIDITRDFAAAALHDNQLLGLCGADTLRGAAGADRLLGGGQNDLLAGRGGDDSLTGGDGHDRLMGGAGDDRLTGGTGRDVMWGGAGADVFVFTSADATDAIADFRNGKDHIGLGALGHGLHWLDMAGFDGVAGALRYDHDSRGVMLLGDLDGDGTADFSVLLLGVAAINAADLLL